MAEVRIHAKQGKYRFGYGVPVWEDRISMISAVIYCFPGFVHRQRLWET